MTEQAVRLLLIRHASSVSDPALPQDEWPLSVQGLAQAEALTEQLRHEEIEEIYSSPLPRAVATVRPLAQALGLTVRLVEDLRERRLTDEHLTDWLIELKRSFVDFDRVLKGGESSRACQERMVDCVSGVARQTPAKTVALCSHGNAIALLMNSLDPAFGFEAWQAIGNPHVFELRWDGESLTRAA